MASDRPFLVVLRCGDNSFHPSWLAKEDGQRNWDLHLSYYGQNPDRYQGVERGDSISFEKGPKYIGLSEYIEHHIDVLSGYEYVAFPDDDLQIVAGNWSKILSAVKACGADLAQPSLDHRSFFSHDVTLRRKRFSHREVDFIEVMTPIFRTDLLREVWGEFTGNKSSWGLDFLWSAHAEKAGKKMVVVDAYPFLHTRRVGKGGQYKGGVSPELFAERDAALKGKGVTFRQGRAKAAWAGNGASSEPLFLVNRREIAPRAYKFLKNKMDINVVSI